MGICSLQHTNLVKELLPCGVGVEGKLQLRIHRGDANVDLQSKVKASLVTRQQIF